MTSLYPGYPFDGSCELSKDADFTLSFDDETFLKVHKCILETASPVFEVAIKECQHDGSLHLTKTFQDTWIVILNHIHPAGKPNSLIDNFTKGYPDKIIDLLTQCQKYGFVTLHNNIDEKVTSIIANYRVSFAPRRSGDKYQYIRARYDHTSLLAIVFSDLPKSEEAFVAYLIGILMDNEELLEKRIENGNKINQHSLEHCTYTVRNIVSQMHRKGCYRFCALFARKMMEKSFCISVCHLSHKAL